jgi:hypothetical protein
MMPEALLSDQTARHKDFGHIIAHANQFYARTGQYARITPAEFFQISEFSYGLPFLVMDFAD